MEKRTVITAVAALLIAAGIAVAMSTPRSYEGCIEKNIGKAHSDAAARAVVSMCRQKFKRTYTDQEVFGVK